MWWVTKKQYRQKRAKILKSRILTKMGIMFINKALLQNKSQT